MQRDALRRTTWVPGMVLVFFVTSPSFIHAGYADPGASGSLLGEASQFISDFNQWNTLHNGLPMQILSTAPATDESGAVMFLFWMWLHDPLGLGAGNLSSGSSVPVGTIGAGQGGNGPPSTPAGGGISGSSLGLNNQPLQTGDKDGVKLSDGPGSGSLSPQNGPVPFDPAPEPASVTLLAVGGFALLLGWRTRSRKSNLS